MRMILDNKITLVLVLALHTGLLYGVMHLPAAVRAPEAPLMLQAIPLPMGEVAPEPVAEKPVAKMKPTVKVTQPTAQERQQTKVKLAVAAPAVKTAATPDRVATMEVAAADKTEVTPVKEVAATSTSNNKLATTSGGGAQGQAPERLEAATEPTFNANYLNNPKPPYPPQSLALGEKGTAFVKVWVSAGGIPDKVELFKSSGFARLDAVAKNTVLKWRFVPAKRGEEAVAGTVVVPMKFSIEQS